MGISRGQGEQGLSHKGRGKTGLGERKEPERGWDSNPACEWGGGVMGGGRWGSGAVEWPLLPTSSSPYAGLHLRLPGVCVGGRLCAHQRALYNELLPRQAGPQASPEGEAHPFHHAQPQFHPQARPLCSAVPTACPAAGGEVAPRAAVPKVAIGSQVARGAWDDDNELCTAPRENLGCYHKSWPGVALN